MGNDCVGFSEILGRPEEVVGEPRVLNPKPGVDDTPCSLLDPVECGLATVPSDTFKKVAGVAVAERVGLVDRFGSP